MNWHACGLHAMLRRGPAMAGRRGSRPATKRKQPARTRRVAARKPSARNGRSRAVETALAALAHEIRTPLTGILALGELLAASDIPERERQWAAAVKGAAEHLANIATLMVDGAKAGRAGLVASARPFDPRALAHAMATTLSARAAAKGLAAEVTISDGLPSDVVGDPVRLRAALENVIDNAVKFTEQGRVSLEVGSEPAGRGRVRLVFTVKDSGIGLTAAEIKRVFRWFGQASDEVARRFGGAGLGLDFVRRLAKTMEGDLTVDSAVGTGSTFRLVVAVSLPQAKRRKASRTRSAAARHKTPRKLRVLCAEDNPYGRVILNTILTELGHAADFVGSGEAAVETVRQGRHDVVLMDIMLPGSGGLEATRRIRALPDVTSRIPIIGLTGRDTPVEQAAARAAGMDDYLPKPVSPSALASALNDCASPPL